MNALNMNNSQLLYRITHLQYSIRRKQDEYNHALKTNNPSRIEAKKKALDGLQTELDALVSAFNTIPAADTDAQPEKSQRKFRWLRFFNVKAAAKRTK